MSYYDELMNHYKAVRARLDGPPPPWRQPAQPMPEPEPEPFALEPEPAPAFHPALSVARRIAQAALAPHGMTWTDAMGPSRTLPYVSARRDVYAALRKHGWSLKKIALFCGRDHTTVLNAIDPRKDRTK